MGLDWLPIPLGQAGKWFSGGTPDMSTSEYWGGSIPWVSPKDMKTLEIWDSEDHITEKGLKEGSLEVEPETVMLVVRGLILAHTLPVAIAMKRLGFNQDIKAIRCRSDVLPRYLARWLVASTGRILSKIVSDTSHGTKRIDIRQLQQYPFPLPSLSEQSAVARILDAADAAIERTRAAIVRARQVKRGLVQELFKKGIGNTGFRNSEIGRIPAYWKVMRVGEALTEAQYGLSMPMGQRGQYPILRMAAIQDGDVLLNDLKYVDLPAKVAETYLLHRGDVLFNRTNSGELVGKIGIFRSDAPAVFASYLIRLKVNPEIADHYFLGQLLASYATQCRIKRFATPGVQQVNINATNLQRVLIAIPQGQQGLKEQREIAEILEKQDQSIRDFEKSVAQLSRLKRGLMQDLLSGRVRVASKH